MSTSSGPHSVATGGQSITIAPPFRNINVYAYHRTSDPNGKGFEKIHRCPYLKDKSIQYPAGDLSGQAGWDVALPFESLKDLAGQLEAGVQLDAETKRRFGGRYREPIRRGEIARLAIMAHGDQAGEWYANGKTFYPLTAKGNKTGTSEPLNAFHPFLHSIGLYTRPLVSTILLMGCLAGQGVDGTALLVELSRVWPGRQVVGFDVVGYRFLTRMWRGTDDADWNAGMKLTRFESAVDFLAQPSKNQDEIERGWNELEWASESSKSHAKIVLDEVVIQYPAREITPAR